MIVVGYPRSSETVKSLSLSLSLSLYLCLSISLSLSLYLSISVSLSLSLSSLLSLSLSSSYLLPIFFLSLPKSHSLCEGQDGLIITVDGQGSF